MRALKWIGIVFGGLCVLLVLIAVLSDPVPRSTSAAASSAPAQPDSGLTMANYQRIASGMRYQQVVDILGDPGTEMSRSDLAGTTTVMYMWKHWTGANMNAMFQNDRLINKAQFGLK